ncbi:protein fem-1 homolog B-like isoform X1 [Microplitis demolitor]|uniref:protein fem-1 homolog B-like isoform X1 n=1 Tax=Microplitis demolitor TaxID=69319 RepID=UPI00235B65EB|nr:protein fem-1 homolog B-like isoform X1 [Microplitis demolitor]
MDDETDILMPFINRIYSMARIGMSMTLYTLLSDKTEEQVNSIINQKVLDEDGQKSTPLIIAARYGHDRVVKMFIDKFKMDIEQEGTVKFDGYVIEGASALWCAAGAGHLSVVKTLVKAGADVNHPTHTNSTPLRAACFDGRLDIVNYLIEHNADIHIANKYNNTCLMIAAHKGHLDVVTFLLEHKADPNVKALCGATALHFAAEWGHVNIVTELLKFGAKMTKNNSGMTPLIAAADRTRANIVECFIEEMDISREDKIEAYELLGASFANDKDNYCLSSAYKYLHKAMELRYADPTNIIRKKLNEPVSAYDNWRESETMQRLESIKNDANAIHMESLAIRERILGTHNPEVPQPIIYRGAVLADNARFDRCIDLWLHALHLRQQNDTSVVKDLLRFAQVFSQMIHVGVDLQFTQVMNVLESSVTELSRNKLKINNTDADEIEQYLDETESNITSALYILTILVKLMALNQKSYDEKDIKKARYLVYKLCALKMTLRDGQTLLHLAVNANTPVDDFHTNDVCKFPCCATAKLLIECGADVNAMDNDRNTPLHVIVAYEKPISDFLTLHGIVVELINAGAHVDTVNSEGKTPYDAATTGVAEIVLRSQTQLSLKCMAAKAVKTYGLSYTGYVPRSLESFIELHGPGLNQG